MNHEQFVKLKDALVELEVKVVALLDRFNAIKKTLEEEAVNHAEINEDDWRREAKRTGPN